MCFFLNANSFTKKEYFPELDNIEFSEQLAKNEQQKDQTEIWDAIEIDEESKNITKKILHHPTQISKTSIYLSFITHTVSSPIEAKNLIGHWLRFTENLPPPYSV